MSTQRTLPDAEIQKELPRIKKLIKEAHDGFKENYDRFNEFRRFIYESSLTAEDITMLDGVGRPTLEFNILPAYISRICGEFSNQEPAPEVIADDPSTIDPKLLQICNDYLRYMFNDASNEHIRYSVFEDMMSGGLGVMGVFTEYANERSMDQIIRPRVEHDPTMCYFDLLAEEDHKGDGRFCGKNFIKTKKEFQKEYKDVPLKTLGTGGGGAELEGFRWAYHNGKEDVVIISDFYEKKKDKKTLVKLSNNKSMLEEEYKEFAEKWKKNPQNKFLVKPTVVDKRVTEIVKIVRYRVMNTTILEYEETDYPYLPLVFFKGAGKKVKAAGSGAIREMCLPYVYHAKDAQRLKNFAGISLANEIENILQHKFAVAMEALPTQQPEWLRAYTDIQKANTLVYKSRYDDNPEMIIPNPIMPLPKIGAPPELFQAFQGTDLTIQQTLGSSDASLGINDNELSGRAMIAGATQANAAMLPYEVGFNHGLQRVGQIIIELLPKYFVTPRTIPLRNQKGERYYMKINEEGAPSFDYESNVLQVHCKTGMSFALQKSQMQMQIKELAGMSPKVAEFIGGTKEGLNFVLDNMEGKGIEALKLSIDNFVDKMDQQQAAAMQAQQQQASQNPAAMRMQIDMQKLQFEQVEAAANHKLKLLELHFKERELTAKMAIEHDKNQIEIKKADDSLKVERMKLHSEDTHKFGDRALEAHDMDHRHEQERIEAAEAKEERKEEKKEKKEKKTTKSKEAKK